METTYADSWSDMAQPCDMDLCVMKWRSTWPIFHSRSMNQYDPTFDLKINVGHWPIFHGPLIVPYTLKTILCMNVIIWYYESVWPDAWPQNKCRSLWPIFHGPVILCYVLKTIWCMTIILGDFGSVWLDVRPENKCMSLWPIFHGPLILPYISKTTWWMSVICSDNETGDPNFDLKINIGQHDLYFMV